MVCCSIVPGACKADATQINSPRALLGLGSCIQLAVPALGHEAPQHDHKSSISHSFDWVVLELVQHHLPMHHQETLHQGHLQGTKLGLQRLELERARRVPKQLSSCRCAWGEYASSKWPFVSLAACDAGVSRRLCWLQAEWHAMTIPEQACQPEATEASSVPEQQFMASETLCPD